MNGDAVATYETIMGIAPTRSASEQRNVGGASGLSSRLATFRRWLTDEAKVQVHPALCIVNGEATDGTKNAPVLMFEPPPSVAMTNSQTKSPHPATGRCGVVDNTSEHALYDRTMGCQIRTVREVRKGDILMNIPRSAMITPDVVASSDAGRAVLACIQPLSVRELGGGTPSIEFWDAFSNTTEQEARFSANLSKSNGTQLLVKILQQRKKAETSLSKAQRRIEEAPTTGDSTNSFVVSLAQPGTISTRAALLAFLIQQRFTNYTRPSVHAREAPREPHDEVGPDSALKQARVVSLDDSPETFGPYARILPSSISLPLCWKRNELALLAGCIPGVPLLQDVAAQTMQLASEFVSLVDAGMTHRFPDVFPPGVITWERWVWAAAVVASRMLPAICYTNEGEASAVAHCDVNSLEKRAIKSSPYVWDELGVLIPLLDILNHEVDSNQITWEQSVPEEANMDDEKGSESHGPRAIVHKRVKKGSEVYTAYASSKSNKDLLLSYGFAQMNNPDDEVKIGWSLSGAVGNVAAPADYVPVFEGENDGTGSSTAITSNGGKCRVYESVDVVQINSWWNPERLSLLEKCASMPGDVVSSLKLGKNLEGMAYVDGSFHPALLSAAVVGTMPATDVRKYASSGETTWGLTKLHQRTLRHYLGFFFSRKLEKLLQNLNNGLKDHFGVQLWTKISKGGLQYNHDEQDSEGASPQGWQIFFDSTAYTWSLEVEKNFYAMGPDSCVLTLYDGHLRALQTAIDCVSKERKFEDSVLRQLQDLDFKLLEIEGEISSPQVEPRIAVPDGERLPGMANGNSRQETPKDVGKGGRRRNRKKGDRTIAGDRPAAIKLHIGNLAYTTTVSELVDFFADLYGRDNILECHIPTERDSGKSRGFGFVTLPEAVATNALQNGRIHEIKGRTLKVERSNSAGSSRPSRPQASGDRCVTCGYRPKFCECAASVVAAPNAPPYHGDSRAPVDVYAKGQRDIGYDYDRSRHRERGGYSRSHSYDRVYRDYDYDRDYRDSRYGRSRSHSRGHDKDRRRDRERRRDRGRSRSQERNHADRSRSRDWDGRSRRGRYSRSRSFSGERPSRRERKGSDGPIAEDRLRSRSRSRSPHMARGNGNGAVVGRKREGSDRKRSRSRDRGKSGRRKRSKKDRKQARSRSASPDVERPRSEKS